jgi:hypothetical protein
LRAFRFELVDGQTVAPRQRVTLRPQNGIKMHARRRFSASRSKAGSSRAKNLGCRETLGIAR